MTRVASASTHQHCELRIKGCRGVVPDFKKFVEPQIFSMINDPEARTSSVEEAQGRVPIVSTG
jgi:hypothetical protein